MGSRQDDMANVNRFVRCVNTLGLGMRQHRGGLDYETNRLEEPRMAESVHQFEIRVAPDDLDRLGHVNNVTYVRYVQDAALATGT